MGDVVKLPLSGCRFDDDSLDEPGHSPSSAMADAAKVFAALGVIEVLGYVATPWRSTLLGNVLELVDRKDGRLLVRWRGNASDQPAAADGTLTEMTGRWALVDQQLVLDVEEILAVEAPETATT